MKANREMILKVLQKFFTLKEAVKMDSTVHKRLSLQMVKVISLTNEFMANTCDC